MILPTDDAKHIRKVLRRRLEELNKKLAETGNITERRQIKEEVDDTLKALSFL